MNRKQLIKALKMPENSTDEQFLAELNETIRKSKETYAGWTLDDFLNKNPEALKEIMVNDPERFETLNSMDLNEKVGEYTRKELQEIGDKRLKRQTVKNYKQQLMSLSEEEREEFKKDYPKEYDVIMKS